jgi:hypothetical protein
MRFELKVQGQRGLHALGDCFWGGARSLGHRVADAATLTSTFNSTSRDALILVAQFSEGSAVKDFKESMRLLQP